MSYPLSSQLVNAATVDLSSGADVLTLTPVTPVEVVSFGFIITTVMADAAGGFVAALDKRVTAASDTGRGDGDLGTLTLTVAQLTSYGAVGHVIRCRRGASAPGTSQAATFAGPAPAEAADVVLPGQQAVLQITTAIDSGYGIPFIEYRQLPRADRSTSIEVVVAS